MSKTKKERVEAAAIAIAAATLSSADGINIHGETADKNGVSLLYVITTFAEGLINEVDKRYHD